MTELLPPGPELGARNRRLSADREHWPAGTLEACEGFDRAHPGWRASWRAEITFARYEHPAGFLAIHESGQWVCGGDLDELDFATGAHPLNWHWSWHKECCARAVEQRRQRGY